MKWNYGEPLTDLSIFERIEQLRGIVIPEALKKLIIEANGACPDKESISINDHEYIFESMLSFNINGDSDIMSLLETIKEKNVLPFGIDAFGNLFCYHVKNDRVLFWNHEEGKYERTNYDLDAFLKNLH